MANMVLFQDTDSRVTKYSFITVGANILLSPPVRKPVLRQGIYKLVKLWFRALSLVFYWFAKVENKSKEGTTKNCNMSDVNLHQCGSRI